MDTIYKKTLKGVEECALRSQGLQLKLRAYLKLVDGVKSVHEIQRLHPDLPEVNVALIVLKTEGYIETLN